MIKLLRQVLVLFVFLGAPLAQAVNLQQFHFSNSPVFATLEDGLLSEGFITTDYEFILVGSYNYVRAPFIYTTQNDRNSEIIDWSHTFNFGGAYRLSDSFQIGLSSFATYQKAITASNIENGEDDRDEKFVLGDSTLDFKYKFFEKSKLAISFVPKIYLPNGDVDFYTTDESLGYFLGFAFDKAFSFAQLVLNVGHKERSEAVFEDLDNRRKFHFSVGALIPITRKLDITTEFYRDTPYDSKNDQIPSEFNVGIRYATTTESAFFAGVGTGSLEESNSIDGRVYAGFKFFPSGKEKSKKVAREEESFGKLFRLSNIYFETGSSEINPRESAKLDKMISYVKKDRYISKIVIEGYASRLGSAALNKKLSRKRSVSVRNYLEENGLDKSNLQIVAYGSENADEKILDSRGDRKVMTRVYRSR